MNVLSLFDGMACGLVALKRAGIKVDNYFASEIDKYAIQIAKKNHPKIQHLGDIEDYHRWVLPRIDLIIAGPPCQGFSIAGKGLNWDDPRSQLFFKAIEILWKYNPRYFLFENVASMKKDIRAEIDELMEVDSVLINSALVCAQNRKRLYWCNWDVEQPKDKGILLKDVIECDVKEPMLSNIYGGFNEKKPREHYNKSVTIRAACGGGHIPSMVFKDKSQTIPATIYKENAKSMIKRGKKGLLVQVGSLYKNNGDAGRIYSIEGKGRTLKGVGGGGGAKMGLIGTNENNYRKLTPIECERLQTLPDNYTEGVSNTQRYKMIGNGWTVDVVAHILKSLTN